MKRKFMLCMLIVIACIIVLPIVPAAAETAPPEADTGVRPYGEIADYTFWLLLGALLIILLVVLVQFSKSKFKIAQVQQNKFEREYIPPRIVQINDETDERSKE